MTDGNDPRDPGKGFKAGPETVPETDPEKHKEFETRRQGAVYQGAFEAVIAILVAVLAGYWLDGYFETEPWLLIVGVVIGFSSFTLRLIRLGRWIQSAEEVQETGANPANDGEESTDGNR